MTKKTALVPSTSAAPVRQIDMPKALQGYLERMQPAALLTPATEAEAWDMAARALHISAAGAIAAGFQFKRLRAQLPAGGFSAGLAERQIPRSTAYDAIEAFDLFSSFPEIELSERFGQLGLSRVRCLGELSLEEFSALAAGQEVRGITYDQAAGMSVRDLDAHLCEWKREHDEELRRTQSDLDRASARADLAEAQLDQAKADLANRAKLDALPDWYRVAQAESPALTEGMAIYLADLVRVIHGHILSAPRKTANDKSLARMAASRSYLGLAGVVAEAQLAMQELLDSFGAEAITGEQQVAVAALNKGELLALAEQRVRMLDMAASQRQTRETMRAAEQPRGRGRPKGAKNKRKSASASR